MIQPTVSPTTAIDSLFERLPTIITFTNKDYIGVAMNWLRAIKKVNLNAQIKILAIDEDSRDALPDEHTLYHPFNAGNFASFMAFRLTALRKILEENDLVIHSDADAIWLGDPLRLIQECSSDMVFSQGTVWPPDVHAKHGIVICCGFYCIRKTVETLELLLEVEKRIIAEGGDQAPMNRIIDERGYEWVVKEPYLIPHGEKYFIASREIIRSKDGPPLSISILPHHIVGRQIESVTPEMLIAHPLSNKTGMAKHEVLSSLGLWMAEEQHLEQGKSTTD